MGNLSAPPSPPTIPTIDISPFLNPSKLSDTSILALVAAVSSASHTYGFFYLTGHGVPVQSQENALQCAKRFFDLPMEERMDVWIKKSVGMSFRGYEPPGGQKHGNQKADTKEAFIFGAEIPPDHPASGSFSMGPNQWPKSIPDEEFRLPLLEYQTKMVDLVKVLLKLLARGLPVEWHCPSDIFDEAAKEDPVIPIRLLHYAPQPVPDEGQFGVGAHSDFGCVTILLQEPGTEGLEVFYPPTQSWIPVPVKADSFVINIGDVMEKWTGGYYRSARHRVVASTTNHRYSVPFFLNGNLKLKIRVLDESGEEVVIGDHIRKRVMETVGAAAKAQIEEESQTLSM